MKNIAIRWEAVALIAVLIGAGLAMIALDGDRVLAGSLVGAGLGLLPRWGAISHGGTDEGPGEGTGQ